MKKQLTRLAGEKLLGRLRLGGDEVATASDAVHRLLAASVHELGRPEYAAGAVVEVTITPEVTT